MRPTAIGPARMDALPRLRRLLALSVAAFALQSACDASGPSTGSSGGVAVPEAASYDVIAIDSVDVVLHGVGVSASRIVAGLIQPKSFPYKSGFRWKNGVLQTVAPSLPQQGGVTIAGINESGDIVGNTDPKRPFIWRAADAAPTRLFPFDTAVTALGINSRGEVLLYPTLEFSPGASIWYQGEVRRFPTSAPMRPRWLTDAGYVIGDARGSLSESVRFLASPFFAPPEGWTRSAHCAGRAMLADRAGRLLSTATRRDSAGLFLTDYFVDDGACRLASKVFPGLTVEGFTREGLYWGVRDGPYAEHRDVVGYGGAFVLVQSLPAVPLANRGWDPWKIVAASDSGLLLASGVKTSGYGVGKPALMLLVKRR